MTANSNRSIKTGFEKTTRRHATADSFQKFKKVGPACIAVQPAGPAVFWCNEAVNTYGNLITNACHTLS